jgi:phage-related protein
LRTFTTSFIAQKNSLDGRLCWLHLIDLSLVSSTARFTSHPETISYAGNTYAPLPLVLSAEEQASDGSLPRQIFTTANFGGLAYQFANDVDLTGKSVTLRLINTESGSGDEVKMVYVVQSAIFGDEFAQFQLGYSFDFDAEGPRRTYNRRDFPGIPFNHKAYAII